MVTPSIQVTDPQTLVGTGLNVEEASAPLHGVEDPQSQGQFKEARSCFWGTERELAIFIVQETGWWIDPSLLDADSSYATKLLGGHWDCTSV